ncbi:MAG: Type 1 glutamine amidotransferase-like domain-containing protein [Actinomycetota bacterium]
MSRAFAFLGSGEFEPWSHEVDRWLLARSARPQGPVLILPTASAPEGDDVFGRWGERGRTHFSEAGIPAEVVPLKGRADADDPGIVRRMDQAAMVYFSGGNPVHLVTTLDGTAFWKALVRRLDEGLAFAGCSAGVSFLGEMAPDSSAPDPRARDIWRPAMAMFRGVVFGPHWDMLDTYVPGLGQATIDAMPAGSRLLAIDERTAVVGDGTRWSVIGTGLARLLEGGRWKRWAPGETFEARLLDPVSA